MSIKTLSLEPMNSDNHTMPSKKNMFSHLFTSVCVAGKMLAKDFVVCVTLDIEIVDVFLAYRRVFGGLLPYPPPPSSLDRTLGWLPSPSHPFYETPPLTSPPSRPWVAKKLKRAHTSTAALFENKLKWPLEVHQYLIHTVDCTEH